MDSDRSIQWKEEKKKPEELVSQLRVATMHLKMTLSQNTISMMYIDSKNV